MVFVAIHFHASDDLHDFPVNTYVKIAFAAHGFEQFTIVAFTAVYQWGKDIDPLSLIIVKDHVDHFLFGIFHHFLAGLITICFSGTGIEQTQIVVDFCRGAYGRAGIPVGGLLFNADDR